MAVLGQNVTTEVKMDDYMKRYEIEAAEGWRGWCTSIPFLTFPAGIAVKVIPPFGGAVARFIARANGKEISVYLDCFDKLGYVESPYWEMYPYEGDTYRCAINETDDLVAKICEALGVEPNNK